MGVPDGGRDTDPDMVANNGGPPFECPDGMAAVPSSGEVAPFCIDRWEASRPDATEQTPGSDSSFAVSQVKVRPWTQVDKEAAASACGAAGKRLCSVDEWQIGCGGPERQFYPYSNSQFEAGRCNSGGVVAATGGFPGCVYEPFGVFDMSGNVLELVETGETANTGTGGSYQDTSSLLLACTNQPRTLSATPAMGFRCCQDAP
jgi:formylglycine-generating enzyme required for sulfatase activity